MPSAATQTRGCPSEQRIASFLEGRLSAVDRAAVESHLDGCEECLRLVGELADQRSELQSDRDTIMATQPEPGDDGFGELRPGTRLGRYVVEEAVGLGGMGIVYAGLDPELGRKVALKLVRPSGRGDEARKEAHGRLVREAQAMARLDHPNVVAVHDVGTYGGQVFLAMAFVEGGTLAAWLKEGPRPWPQVQQRFLEAARGLAAAHDAGLVHRDFKPANVLLGADGTAQVVDFGLVRPIDGGAVVTSESTPVLGSLSDEAMTRTGAVMGTPAYMAPEQYRGQVAGARADQFSLCVALYEAAYGVRPFEGRSMPEIYEAIMSGRLAPPQRKGAPRWLRAVLRRGLAAAPEDRWPDMHAVCEALSGVPARRRRRGAVVVAGMAGLSLGAWALRAAPADPCAQVGAEIEQVWSPDQRQTLLEHFEAVAGERGTAVGERVAARLDAQAEAWAEQRRDTCHAQVRGEQSDLLIDRRHACLDRRQLELHALVEVLADAPAEGLREAPTAVERLTPASVCGEEDLLRRAPDEPESPQAREAVRAARAQLASVEALSDLLQHEPAEQALQAAEQAIEATGFQPLRAEAQVLEGMLQLSLGHQAQAEATLIEAAELAAQSEAPQVAAEAWLGLLWTVGVEQARYREGQWIARMAISAVAQAGDPDRMRATLLHYRAAMARGEGDLDAAIVLEEEALVVARSIDEGPSHELITSLKTLGLTYLDKGELDEGEAHLTAALDAAEELYGPHHTALAHIYNDLGVVAANREQWEAARAQMRRALEIYAEFYGDEHPHVLNTMNNLSALYSLTGDFERARGLAEQVLQQRLAILGPAHNETGESHQQVGALAFVRGDYAAAAEHLAAAVEIREQSIGKGHPDLQRELSQLGSAYARLDRWEEAEAAFERALGLARAHPERGPVEEATHECELAGVLLHRSELTKAETLARRGMEVVDAEGGPSLTRAMCRVALGKAVYAQTGRQREGLAVVRQAASMLQPGDGVAEVLGHEVDQWLAEHDPSAGDGP